MSSGAAAGSDVSRDKKGAGMNVRLYMLDINGFRTNLAGGLVSHEYACTVNDAINQPTDVD